MHCSLSELLPTFCLETGVKSHQEGVGGGLLEDVLLSLHPVNVLQGAWRHDDAINHQQASHVFQTMTVKIFQIKMSHGNASHEPAQCKGRVHLQADQTGRS